MKLHVHLTDEDYIQYNIYYTLNNKTLKKQLMFRRCFPFLLYLFTIPILVLLHWDTKRMIFWSILWLGYSIIQFYLRPKSVQKNIRKNILKLKEEGTLLREPDADWHFTDDSIHCITRNSSELYHYSDVLGIYETTDHIFVMISAVSAIILPLRDLGDQKDALLALLREKCPHIAQ